MNEKETTRALIAVAGNISGFIYASKTGGGFWRYIGYGFLGGITGRILGNLILPDQEPLKKLGECSKKTLSCHPDIKYRYDSRLSK